MSAMHLDTDEGITGVSFGGGKVVVDMVNDLLVGRDPRGVRGHWKRMVDAVFKGNNGVRLRVPLLPLMWPCGT